MSTECKMEMTPFGVVSKEWVWPINLFVIDDVGIFYNCPKGFGIQYVCSIWEWPKCEYNNRCGWTFTPAEVSTAKKDLWQSKINLFSDTFEGNI